MRSIRNHNIARLVQRIIARQPKCRLTHAADKETRVSRSGEDPLDAELIAPHRS